MLEPVERAGDRRRGADLGADHDQVRGGGHTPPELLEDRHERGGRIGAPAAGEREARAPELVVHLIDAELAQVARERRLGDCAAGGGERLAQLELCADTASPDHALDQALTLLLLQRTGVGMHAGV
jgi:hypothetical protein